MRGNLFILSERIRPVSPPLQNVGSGRMIARRFNDQLLTGTTGQPVRADDGIA